jgi:hypothetical protein
MLANPNVLLRLEGAAIFSGSLYLYHLAHGSWIAFLVLFLVPDLAMLGYLINARVGAPLYNLMHTEVLPVALAGMLLATRHTDWAVYAIIWLAHIGWDRAFGYGLKYPTVFKDTHLQRVA